MKKAYERAQLRKRSRTGGDRLTLRALPVRLLTGVVGGCPDDDDESTAVVLDNGSG